MKWKGKGRPAGGYLILTEEKGTRKTRAKCAKQTIWTLARVRMREGKPCPMVCPYFASVLPSMSRGIASSS